MHVMLVGFMRIECFSTMPRPLEPVERAAFFG